jgi:tripartite-type tricarboxylate transporter receptor subunit TctC
MTPSTISAIPSRSSQAGAVSAQAAGRLTRVTLAGLVGLLLVLTGALWSGPARAQGAAPLKLVVPFTPGTGIDLIARQIGPHLAERLGRPVVVENKAGASGNLGTEAVVRAAPDGATLLVTVNTLVMNRALYPGLGFDPVKDLDPVSLTSWGTLLLVASPKSGITTSADLLTRARAQPGALNYGSPGNGTPHHLAMELVKQVAGVDVTHIPYRGTGPALTDLLGGQIDLMFLPIHVALQHVKAGKLMALGISSDKPHPLLPDVVPLRQQALGQGAAGLDVEMWYGVLAPRGLPAAQLERLNRELRAILALPDVKTAFETQGMTPTASSPGEFQGLIERDAARWTALIKARNIKAD